MDSSSKHCIGGSDKSTWDKNKCKKAKWLSEEALQIVEKREVNSREERERYTQVNAEFQRIERREAFLEGLLKWTMQRNRGKQ